MTRATKEAWVELLTKIAAAPPPDLGPEIGEPTSEEREAAQTKRCPNGCGASLDPGGRHLHGGGWNCHRCGAILNREQYDAVVSGTEVPGPIEVKPWPWPRRQ